MILNLKIVSPFSRPLDAAGLKEKNMKSINLEWLALVFILRVKIRKWVN